MGRRNQLVVVDSAVDDLIDVELESRCECGHRNPEHSSSGQCHGCHSCDDDGIALDDDHVYQRCRCLSFQLAVAVCDEQIVSFTA